jgi:hypothetical protein
VAARGEVPKETLCVAALELPSHNLDRIVVPLASSCPLPQGIASGTLPESNSARAGIDSVH